MKASVVVPTFRRPNLLIRCVEALRQQKFPLAEFEIIIVSDGPDERTKQALNEVAAHGPDVRYYSLPRKAGPAAARNYGWRCARSKFIAFTDDDCIPDRDWLSSLWTMFLRIDGSRCAFSGKTVVPIPDSPTDYELNISNLERAEFITANCACTKAALESVGGFDERFAMAWREDSDLQFKFMVANIPIVPCRNAIVIHPVRKAPWGISLKEEKKGVYDALLFKKYPALYREKIQAAPPWNYYAIVLSLLILLISILLNSTGLMLTSLACWSLLTIVFVWRRLRNTSRSLSHIAEMIFTSLVIPILSLYWLCYGAFKYRVPSLLV